ncbi:SLAM family member 5-like isoform X2 [Anguilla anguilla]|uniref:SLAM family member 5-like isoform X2 n=1 Tax=Anguilla anguilla TaxID=7936 RepID=UPI0015ACC560|nr:SLAM family member 5-like isoform X2 [Anguilla anguilla]
METNAAFKGRLIVNYETGALNISSLREEDSGEYVFERFRLSGPLRPKTIQLHIYERIVSVQVTSQVNNSTDGSSCNVTLSCSVIGGSQVALSWSRNGENIAGAENRATLTVSPTRAEEDYTCTAINPISSLSNTVTAGPCQTVLQVSGVHGTSLVLNGAVGESIVLPTDEEGPIRGPGLMEWLKNKVTVIKLVSKQDSSPFETRKTNAAFKGRLIVNNETGALNISSLREEDSGEYVFEGIGSSTSLRPKTIQLHIYERIVSVQVTSQVNNNADGTSCNATLSCSVIGGSQVVLSWSRNGENIAGAENRTTLSVSPTRAEEDHTCTAINPVGSQSNTTRPCQTGLDSHGLSLCELKSVLFSLGLVAMVSAVIAVNVRERCCRDQWGLRKEDESVRVMEKIPT